MNKLLKNTILNPDYRLLKKYKDDVTKINRLEAEISTLSDEELKGKTNYFKGLLDSGKSINDIKYEAFAVVREASKRVLGLRHYDVQLMGGLAMLEGNIAEMATGEGKTLVASLPSYLIALEGKGVHIVTVNEYLANRDKELIGQIHEFLGLTVGITLSQATPHEKRAAYAADITYGIGTEFGFDFLRDNMVQDPSERTQRPFHFAIVDEIDSVLIDEAKTPLIIAGKTSVRTGLYNICAQVAKSLKPEEYSYDPETKACNFTEEGILKIEASFEVDNLFDLEHQVLYHSMIQALRARLMLRRDVDYIVHEGEIKLVDMFTGRIMEGRTLSDGLHQALEAKEGLQITDENKVQASISIQNFFRMYPTLAGMTGTAKTEEKEFLDLYNMKVLQVPTNKEVNRIDLQDLVYMTSHQKYTKVTEVTSACHKKGQPVLIGTTSIEQSETVSKYLDEANLPYELLNAKTVEQENTLISLAGQKGQITIATNMAGRGTDIILGEGVSELGGLCVIGTERHESRRVDNQLKGRAGRQGDPGNTQFIISLEDELMIRYAKDDIEDKKKSLKTNEDGLITNKDIHEFVNKVQRICEGANYSFREFTVNIDDIVNEQRDVFYTLRNKILHDEDVLENSIKFARSCAEEIVKTYCLEEQVAEEWDLDNVEKLINEITPGHHFSVARPIETIDELQEQVTKHMDNYIVEVEEMSKEHDGFVPFLKRNFLLLMDNRWIQHLEAMTRLKDGIGLRGYGQDSPIRQYQMEGYEIFSRTYRTLEREISNLIARIVKQTYKMNEQREQNKEEKVNA